MCIYVYIYLSTYLSVYLFIFVLCLKQKCDVEAHLLQLGDRGVSALALVADLVHLREDLAGDGGGGDALQPRLGHASQGPVVVAAVVVFFVTVLIVVLLGKAEDGLREHALVQRRLTHGVQALRANGGRLSEAVGPPNPGGSWPTSGAICVDSLPLGRQHGQALAKYVPSSGRSRTDKANFMTQKWPPMCRLATDRQHRGQV